jgi:3-oxoacyl-[acyl-carrier protein] reductase
MSDDAWNTVIETDLNGAFRLMRRALRPMMRARAGRIVNISSVVGLRANPGQANYAAAKAGLIALTKTTAVEVARRGITINAVAPGWIDTDMTADVSSELLAQVPARRAGTPEEVAACVRFLASPQAAYVTGAVLSVDGGLAA